MSLKIGQHVHATLGATASVIEVINDRIFPIATLRETQFPFVVYEREDIEPSDTKDGYDDEQVLIAVYVFSDHYAESVDVAHRCRKALSGKVGRYDDFGVTKCVFTGAKEACAEQTFVHKLTFRLTTEELTV